VLASVRRYMHYNVVVHNVVVNSRCGAVQGTQGTARTGSAATTSACWWTRTTMAANLDSSKRASLLQSDDRSLISSPKVA
jgi:hypothetical protein